MILSVVLGVVLDFDGTIIDSKTAGVPIFLQLAEEFGYPLSPQDAARLPQLWGTHWRRLLSDLLPGVDATIFLARWQILEKRRYGQFPAFRGARGAIEAIRFFGRFVALHTNRGRDLLSERLGEANIPRTLFDAIVTCDDGPPKPHPDSLRFVLKSLNETCGVDEPAAICVVSDTCQDAVMSLTCGCPFIGVLTGTATREDFARLREPITVVNSIADVPGALKIYRRPRRQTRATSLG